MRTCFFACIAAATVAAPGLAAAAIDDGLAARYTFDDCTAADVSGNGNHGTFVGNVVCAPGNTGTGIKLGGFFNRGYVAIPASPSLAAVDDFTYVVWFRIDGYASMNGWGGLSEYGLHALFAKAGDRSGLDLRTVRSTTTGELSLMASNGNCCGLLSRGSPSFGVFGLGAWHMATISQGGGVLNLYFDGELKATMPAADFMINPAMASMPLLLGIDEGSSWYPLDGMLDEVRVYNRALSDVEVAALFRPVVFGGFQAPLRADGSGVHKQGSTIPVKFQLTDYLTGAPVTDAVVKLFVAKVTDGVVGTVEEAVSTSAADVGNQFRYDAVAGAYLFNLSTRALVGGSTYQLTVRLEDGSTRSALISLK